MIAITSGQLDQFEEDREETFVSQRLDLLRARTGRNEDDAVLHDAALALLRRARAHGLAQTDDLIAFITLGLMRGHQFDEHPPLRAILHDPRWSARQRLSVLLNHSDPRGWNRLAQGAAHV